MEYKILKTAYNDGRYTQGHRTACYISAIIKDGINRVKYDGMSLDELQAEIDICIDNYLKMLDMEVK